MHQVFQAGCVTHLCVPPDESLAYKDKFYPDFQGLMDYLDQGTEFSDESKDPNSVQYLYMKDPDMKGELNFQSRGVV